MMDNPAAQHESPIKSFHCSHCPLIFKSKVFFFEHLNSVHDLSVEAALRDAGLAGTNRANSDSSRSASEYQSCDFKACSQDVSEKHEMYHKKSEDQNVKGSVIISENLGTAVSVITANPNKKAAGAKEISSSVMSTSQTKCTVNLSGDLNIYKKPLQTITKYLATSCGSNGKPPVMSTHNSMLLDSTRGTDVLQESPSISSPDSNGVFKVTAKSMIDLSRMSHQYLLNDPLLIADLTPTKPIGHIREQIPNYPGKRTRKESLKSPPAKKIKTMDKEEAKASKQESSSSTDFTFEVSEDEEEKSLNLVNGDMTNPTVYFCKHCDYSDVGIQSVSIHYQNDHPYVRYNSDYVKDVSDQSATFRCLECPIEFLSIADLKKHYTENHPEAPNIFTMQLRELSLVFKCFKCPFTINTLKALRGHYKEKHPTHEVNNSLMYCRYLATRCQEESSQLNTCEKTPGSERISTESCPVPCEEVKNAPLTQHETSKGADVVFHCNNCKFSHKSVVVMHVHYQKSHPKQAVTTEKIEQLACVTSQTTPKKMTESPNSVTTDKSTCQKEISDSQKDEAKMSQQKISFSLINPKHTPETSKTHSESPKTKKVESAEDGTPAKHDSKMSTEMDSSPTSPNAVFYCRFCSYSSTNIKSVVGHHNAKHTKHSQIGIQEILMYSAEFQKKKCQSEAEASASTSSSTSVTKFHAYKRAEDLFYCQKCNYGNPSVKGLISHQSQIHPNFKSDVESILKYTALICDEIEKSKSQAKKSSVSTDLPLPLINEGDEHMFFCHFCNYRQSTVGCLLQHYKRRHCGFVVGAQQIRLHTSMVLEQIQKLHLKATSNQEVNQLSVGEKGNDKKKTKKPDKSSSVSASSSKKTSQTQKILQCQRCSYSTQHVYLFRRHIRKSHKSHRSVSDSVKVSFKQGNLQSGYCCELCVFAHKKATVLYKHYQEKHPGHTPSLKPKVKYTDGISVCDGTDGSLPSQRSGQNDTKIYPCRACSFKGCSVSSITHHYRAVHPWSVKEDGSVLDVINRKKPSANKQVEDSSEIPASFHSYQVPLEFEESPDSSHEETDSSTGLKCPHCPARFHTQHGLKTHYGMKHQQFVTEQEQQKQQVQVSPRVQVFKCPHCTYVNTSQQGVLTHCQMRHPTIASKADNLNVDDADLHNWDGCLKKKGPSDLVRLSGYMCKTCTQIHATLEKLNNHCEEDHNQTVQSALKPLCVNHKNAPVSSAQNRVYKCVICSKSYFKKRHLGCHYTKMHGKDAFFKYYAPLYQNVPKKPAPTSPDHPCQSSTATDENKKLVFKCPSCPYVNASHHGTLTHYKKKHPTIITSTDEFQTEEILLTNMIACRTGKSFNERGYMCKICPQIHESLNKLQIHFERDHDQASEHSAEIDTEKQPLSMDHDSQGTVLEASKHKDSAVSTTEIKAFASHCIQKHGKEASRKHCANVFRQTRKRPQPPSAVQNKYKCDLCTYSGVKRRYLWSHYKKYHRFDALTTYKHLLKYSKPGKRVSNLPKEEPESASEKSAQITCKKCPNLLFDSFELLIAHYSTFHSSDFKLDFTVLYPTTKSSTGVYKCCHCKKQLNGIRKLRLHLMNHHREGNEKRENAARIKASLVTITPEAKSTELFGQDEDLTLETVEELAQRNVTQLATFSLPTSPLSSPSKPDDLQQPDTESREDKHTCKQCVQTFMSLQSLRCHERSHAALVAIKKLDNLPTSVLKHNINKYILFKYGTVRPFLCCICSYRTTSMGLLRSHFMKNHQDVIMDPAETDNQDEMADKEPPNSSEELNTEPDEEPEITEESLYLEPPDVQRQLNHYSLMAEAGASSKANMQQTKLTKNSLLHCEFCNFTSEHLSSVRRHLLNRHGKKILRCKDCNFFTGLRKTLEMHIETGHSTYQSEPTHQKDFRCPFCLYQTKNKSNMIDHIMLHREERVVPIEVRRPKLSRYLQGIVFRCHKCTFSSASAENLRLHMMKHDDIKPYKCRLCYFDCTQLCELEAHLCDKHQVLRNHALVGQISLDQQEANVGRMLEEDEEEEPLSNSEHHNETEDTETEFVTDCNEVPHEAHARNPAVNGMRENIIRHQQQRQGGNEESLTKSSAFHPQYKNKTNPNTTVPEKHGQDTQERARSETLVTDTAKRQGMENLVDPNVSGGNNADTHFEDCSDPDKERQMNENQTKPGGNVDSRIIKQREEAAEGSSTKYVRIAEKAQAHRLQIRALQDRTLNIKTKVKDDIIRHILLLDEETGIRRLHRKAVHDRTVKIEHNIKTEVEDNVVNQTILRDENGSIALAHNPKNHPEVRTAVTPDLAKRNLMLANIRSQECFTAERHLPTPSCAQHKISRNKQGDKESLGVSFTNHKEEVQTNCEELTDSYGAMPVLENEYLKEEPLGCCKEEEEEEEDHFEQKQHKMITENIESRHKNQEHEEGDKGVLTAVDRAAEVRRSSVTEKKQFICKFCGRNLMNWSELERHIMRHGI